MKKKLRFLSCLLILLIVTNSTVFANSQDFSPPVTAFSMILDGTIKRSVVKERATRRGDFFSAADLAIVNENGEIGVEAHAYMGVPVDELYISIYLDRRVNNKWTQVAAYDFEFFAEDYPEGLTSESVVFIIDNQPKNEVYRLRASFAAYKGGQIEGFGPVTDGVLIE